MWRMLLSVGFAAAELFASEISQAKNRCKRRLLRLATALALVYVATLLASAAVILALLPIYRMIAADLGGNRAAILFAGLTLTLSALTLMVAKRLSR